MRMLALDLGTQTGWCLSYLSPQGARQQVSGSTSFKPRSYDGAGMRYLNFSRWLDDVAKNVDWVAFEEVKQIPRSAAAGHVYGGFLAHLMSWCEANKVPYSAIPSGQIKKHWTGRGNAKKDLMVRVCRQRGFSPVDDNEADAIAIHDLMLHQAKANEAPSHPMQRPAPDRQPRARVQVGIAPLARPRVRVRAS